MPKALGSAICIVGTLVGEQVAVQAGMVSVPMVSVVSSTSIASVPYGYRRVEHQHRLRAIARFNLVSAITRHGFP